MRRAHRFFATLVLAFIASAGAAFAKDSVTIGMILEPPGLDPTTAPAAARTERLGLFLKVAFTSLLP